jgi:hypothetical protein
MIGDKRAKVTIVSGLGGHNSLHLKGIVATAERREENSRKCLQVDIVL